MNYFKLLMFFAHPGFILNYLKLHPKKSTKSDLIVVV